MSKELRDILGLVRRGPGPFALATLVGADGASYRRPGARMLLDGNGPVRGSLSGGCLDGDLHARGLEVLADGRPRRLRYDLRGELDLVWGSGSGCEGVLDVLVEPLLGVPDWMAWIERAWAARTPLQLRTGLGPDDLGRRSLEDAPGEAFRERLEPPPALWILGAGDDSRPLVRLAAELGWQVGVLDHRPAFAQPGRFPGATEVHSGTPSALLPGLPLDRRSAVVLMTHHYAKDLEALRLMLPSQAGYVGLMGSRARTARLLAELAEEGLRPDGRLHAPVGLDLGAREPEPIALAILAEVQAAFSGATARPLGEACRLAPCP